MALDSNGKYYKDIAGIRFGNLIAIESLRQQTSSGMLWRCVCDCGSHKNVPVSALTSGKVKSCGCMRGKWGKEGCTPHDLIKHRLYRIWSQVKQRCTNPNQRSYRWYGAKGITVCDEWSNSFMSFYNWAMANGYADGLTIDRINSSGNYEPSNCRWVTQKEQIGNRDITRLYEYNGQSLTLREWSKITGISEKTLYSRVHRPNWSIERALTTPVDVSHDNIAPDALISPVSDCVTASNKELREDVANE